MSLLYSLFLVIFGVFGDLIWCKLMFVLIKIYNGKCFFEYFVIIGCVCIVYMDEIYCVYLKEELIKFGFFIKEEMEILDDFFFIVYYQFMDLVDEIIYFLLNDCLKEFLF